MLWFALLLIDYGSERAGGLWGCEELIRNKKCKLRRSKQDEALGEAWRLPAGPEEPVIKIESWYKKQWVVIVGFWKEEKTIWSKWWAPELLGHCTPGTRYLGPNWCDPGNRSTERGSGHRTCKKKRVKCDSQASHLKKLRIATSSW